jgi:hypothetical protein
VASGQGPACLQERRDIPCPPETKRDKSKRSKLKTSPIGYFHIEIAAAPGIPRAAAWLLCRVAFMTRDRQR